MDQEDVVSRTTNNRHGAASGYKSFEENCSNYAVEVNRISKRFLLLVKDLSSFNVKTHQSIGDYTTAGAAIRAPTHSVRHP